MVVLNVDIQKWDSPVCRQFRINSVPHFKVYNGSGQLQAEGRAALDYLSKVLR
ncbi:MAG: hypothetical protein HY319_01800 [Armatimonadetes bacterium]|nr:hypothetical protein [Armatimonadota bacterium]